MNRTDYYIPHHIYKGTRMPPSVTETAVDAVENLEIRDDDILLTGYPKSGTHWMVEVIQLILADGDASKLDYQCRKALLEGTDVKYLSGLHKKQSNAERVKYYPSPRVLKTHFRPYLVPKEAWTEKIPIIYLLRNPKDVFLSSVEFQKVFTLSAEQDVDFDKFIEAFLSGHVHYDGCCQHVTSFEALKGKENILFVTYEEAKQDPHTVIKSIAQHIGRDISDDVIEKVVANSTVEAMKQNYNKAMESLKQGDLDVNVVHLTSFINKGVAGRWKTQNSEDK